MIAEAVHGLLYAHEAPVIDALLPLMLALLPILEPRPEQLDAPTYDKVMARVLSAMIYESKLAQRHAYALHLGQRPVVFFFGGERVCVYVHMSVRQCVLRVWEKCVRACVRACV